jgi:cell division inhibitor SepF
VNLESLNKENAQRVIDFLSGAVYALDGNIQKISSGIFIVVPLNVDIMGDLKTPDISEEESFPWVK